MSVCGIDPKERLYSNSPCIAKSRAAISPAYPAPITITSVRADEDGILCDDGETRATVGRPVESPASRVHNFPSWLVIVEQSRFLVMTVEEKYLAGRFHPKLYLSSLHGSRNQGLGGAGLIPDWSDIDAAVHRITTSRT